MKRILFVDDESQILDGIRRLLRSERDHWDMHFCRGGEAALALCETTQFDVVISDMRMPGMDGATLLTHIRDRWPGTARLILSGYSEAALAARAVPVAYRVLTKPCVAEELRASIQRVCTLQDLLCTPELRAVVGTIGELPSLSRTYLALSKAVDDPMSQIATVADIVEQDAAMSAKVLQLTNSAFFGLAQRVTSLRRAVSYLGMNTIRNLALVSDTFRVFEPDPSIPPLFLEKLQEHAQHTALIAAALPVEAAEHDTTVVAALLHDIGSLLLASKLPEKFVAALNLARQRGCKQHEAEEELLGISHAEIGAYLLGLWGIDQNVVEAIAYHHRPTRIAHTALDSSVAIYVADLLAHECASTGADSRPPAIRETEEATLQELGIQQRLPELRACALAALNHVAA